MEQRQIQRQDQDEQNAEFAQEEKEEIEEQDGNHKQLVDGENGLLLLDEKQEENVIFLKQEQEEEQDEEEEWEALDQQDEEELSLRAKFSKTRINTKEEPESELLKENQTGQRATRTPVVRRFPSCSTHTTTLLLSEFPPTFKTADLVSPFEKISANLRIEWINDTSALVIFPNSVIAKKAYLTVAGHPFFTAIPYTPLSESESGYTNPDLVGEVSTGPRPTTTDMVARRLIAGALGLRPKKKSTMEQENDTKKLDSAREKRQAAKNQREASDSLFD